MIGAILIIKKFFECELMAGIHGVQGFENFLLDIQGKPPSLSPFLDHFVRQLFGGSANEASVRKPKARHNTIKGLPIKIILCDH